MSKPFELAILFTGHMVDLPGRPTPRFPQTAEPAAWRAIRDAVDPLRLRTKGRVLGIASGARGGDLLFLEACRLFGIDRRMVLPFPPEVFVETSVAGVPNSQWEARFWDNWRSLPDSEKEVLLPSRDDRGYELCNQRMLALARDLAASQTLIALWDGKSGDGPGGTAQFQREVGGTPIILDMNALTNA
jgi:hypothetical protein